MTLLEYADRVRPVEARLYAHLNGLPMSRREIMRRGKFSATTVTQLSRMTSWESVQLGVADRFLKACDATDGRRVRFYFKRWLSGKRGFPHISRALRQAHGRADAKYYSELIRIYLAASSSTPHLPVSVRVPTISDKVRFQQVPS